MNNFEIVGYVQGRRHGFEGGGVKFFLGPPYFARSPPLFGGVIPKCGGGPEKFFYTVV